MMLPQRNPPMACTPPIKPTTNVAKMAISPAGTSSFNAPVVAISMHLSYSAQRLPCLPKADDLLELAMDLRHHALCVAVHSEHQHRRKNRGIAAPTSRPKNTMGFMISKFEIPSTRV